jgi:hypothetical protein
MPLAEPSLVRAEFMTAHDLEVLRPHSNLGRPDTDLVCYVEVQGLWRLYNYAGTFTEFRKVFEVFDAYSGNCVMLAAWR